MKSSKLIPFILAGVLITIYIFGCEFGQSPHQTLTDAIQKVPNLTEITGGENAIINVQQDGQYSMFKVDVGNLGFNTEITNGTYHAWCAQLGVPINYGEDIRSVKLNKTNKDATFNQLSYIVNNRKSYEQMYSGLSWKEIQIALWIVLETNDLKLETIANRLVPEVDGFNPDYVNGIILDLKQNGLNFKPGFGDIQLILLQSDLVQDPLIEQGCQTAMARMNDDPNDFEHPWYDHPWFTYLIVAPGDLTSENTPTYYLYAAQTIRVGEVFIWKDGDYLKVKIVLDEEYMGMPLYMSESHVDINLDDTSFKPPPEFGTWDSNIEVDCDTGPTTHTLSWNNDWDVVDLYIAVHAVVCVDDGTCGL
jgi:hypothetical protein